MNAQPSILMRSMTREALEEDTIRRRIHLSRYDSPCGPLSLGVSGDRLCLCDWNDKSGAERNKRRLLRSLNAEFTEEPSEVILRAKLQLNEYFAGKRKAFDIPLHPVGTGFQKRVWNALLEIPYGETRSYKEIALRIGSPKGLRAVAQAIGANGISIFIPCHRVIGSDHSLTGFAGGLEAKRLLIELEAQSQEQRMIFATFAPETNNR